MQKELKEFFTHYCAQNAAYEFNKRLLGVGGRESPATYLRKII